MLTFIDAAFKTKNRDLHVLDLLDFIWGTIAFDPYVSGVVLLLVKEKALLRFLNGTHPRA